MTNGYHSPDKLASRYASGGMPLIKVTPGTMIHVGGEAHVVADGRAVQNFDCLYLTPADYDALKRAVPVVEEDAR